MLLPNKNFGKPLSSGFDTTNPTNVTFSLAGSIEVGITTHNPDLIEFPATMTNTNSGT